MGQNTEFLWQQQRQISHHLKRMSRDMKEHKFDISTCVVVLWLIRMTSPTMWKRRPTTSRAFLQRNINQCPKAIKMLWKVRQTHFRICIDGGDSAVEYERLLLMQQCDNHDWKPAMGRPC